VNLWRLNKKGKLPTTRPWRRPSEFPDNMSRNWLEAAARPAVVSGLGFDFLDNLSEIAAEKPQRLSRQITSAPIYPDF
jgi:hypothetical protein